MVSSVEETSLVEKAQILMMILQVWEQNTHLQTADEVDEPGRKDARLPEAIQLLNWYTPLEFLKV